MKQYIFVERTVCSAEWVVEAETLAEAKERFAALGEEGEPPVKEDFEDCEVIAVYEDGVLVEEGEQGSQ